MSNQNNYEVIDSIAVCKSHKIDAAPSGAADCPTCDNTMNAPGFNRCSDCAISQNKCSYCDGSLK